MIAEEEIRAAAYRAQLASRVAYRRAQLIAFAGDPAAAARVKTAWQPIIDARLDPEGSIRSGS